jgi:hypothetical protein
MRTFHRILACAASAVVASGSLLLAGPPAQASGNCPSEQPVDGTVTGRVSPGGADVWSNSGVGLRTFTLQPAGDLELYVYGSDCGTRLCSSNSPGPGTETCTTSTPGTVNVIVWPGATATGPVDYSLTAPPSTLPNPSRNASDDCATTPTSQTFVDSAYSRVSTRQVASDQTWVCARIDTGRGAGGQQLSVGGKFVVQGAAASAPAVPTVDAAVTACASPGNAVPGPHPLVAASLGDPNDPATYLPILLDSYSGSGEAWVCLRAGTTAVRVALHYGVSVGTPSVSFVPDQAGYHANPWPQATATPSGSCEAAGRFRAEQYADSTTLGVRTFLYTWESSPNVTKICVRTEGLVSAGGVLTVDATGLYASVPVVESGSDTTGCTTSVAKVEQPVAVEIRRSAGTLPASVCLTVGSATTRVTVSSGAGAVPANVTWTPDPGTP